MPFARLFAGLMLLVAATSPAWSQGSATVRGHVRSARTGEPVAGATVLVVGTRTGAIADANGLYVMGGAPAGTITVRARFIGYADLDQVVTLADGQVQELDFRLVESITTLGEIRTQAAAAEREVFESRPNLGVTLLSGKVVSSIPRLGEADVLRAAQMLPGVMARNDFTAGLNVRGGEADQNVILLDGYPIFNPFHLGGLFGTFIDGAVEGLELRTGGFPAQYGGRLSSVLDVQSRQETRGGLHGSATLSMLATSATLSSAFSEGRGALLVSARRTYADKVLDALDVDALPYYFRDAHIHGSYQLTPRTSIAATFYDGRDDMTGNLAAFNDEGGAGGFTFWWGNRVAGMTLKHALTDSLRFTQRASYSIFETSLDLGGGGLRLDDVVRETTIKGSLDYRRNAHAPSVGYELSRDDMAYTAGSRSAAIEFLREEQQPVSAALFISDIWTPSTKWVVEGGLRYERLSGSGWSAISPRLSAKHFLTSDFALTAAVGRYSQWLHSLAREDIPVRLFDFWTASDDVIPVSRATHYVVGAERWFGAHRFTRLETYVKDYDSLLEPNLADDPNVHGDEYLNTVGQSYGADLLLRQLERGRWSGWIAYTYTFSTRTGPDGTYAPGQDRRNYLNVLMSYRSSPKYVISTRFGYASGTPFTDIVGEICRREFDIGSGGWDTERRCEDRQAVGGARNARRLPATQRLDIAVTRESSRRVKVSPFFSIVNAYNAKNVFMYEFDFGASPPTRTSYSQIPFLPSLGVTIEW